MKKSIHVTSATIACASLMIVTAFSTHAYSIFGDHTGTSKPRNSSDATLTTQSETKKSPTDSHLHTHIDRVSLKNFASSLHADPRSLRKYLNLDTPTEVSLLD